MTNAIDHRHPDAWGLIDTAVAEDGGAPHPQVRRLLAPRVQRRDLADAVHAICTVHGHRPGMADEALLRCAQPDACSWLAAAAAGFGDERAGLARLAAAAGPLPSTPGQADSAAALAGVRHAIDMLARSDRGGCATGAAAALIGDWSTIRAVLARAADCFAVDLPPVTLPARGATRAAILHLAGSPGAERAMMFGARQLLAQHRGLWDLLEARASARG